MRTTLALDDEQFLFLDSEGHGRTIISEHKANVYMKKSDDSVGVFAPLDQRGKLLVPNG